MTVVYPVMILCAKVSSVPSWPSLTVYVQVLELVCTRPLPAPSSMGGAVDWHEAEGGGNNEASYPQLGEQLSAADVANHYRQGIECEARCYHYLCISRI